jgi:hypothetical protein
MKPEGLSANISISKGLSANISISKKYLMYSQSLLQRHSIKKDDLPANLSNGKNLPVTNVQNAII